MPVLSGEDVLRKNAENERGSTFSQMAIALAAYAHRGEMERFLDECFEEYISITIGITEYVCWTNRGKSVA
jgi:hypothetical protein